jgi:hypothetical protein
LGRASLLDDRSRRLLLLLLLFFPSRLDDRSREDFLFLPSRLDDLFLDRSGLDRLDERDRRFSVFPSLSDDDFLRSVE